MKKRRSDFAGARIKSCRPGTDPWFGFCLLPRFGLFTEAASAAPPTPVVTHGFPQRFSDHQHLGLRQGRRRQAHGERGPDVRGRRPTQSTIRSAGCPPWNASKTHTPPFFFTKSAHSARRPPTDLSIHHIVFSTGSPRGALRGWRVGEREHIRPPRRRARRHRRPLRGARGRWYRSRGGGVQHGHPLHARWVPPSKPRRPRHITSHTPPKGTSVGRERDSSRFVFAAFSPGKERKEEGDARRCLPLDVD